MSAKHTRKKQFLYKSQIFDHGCQKTAASNTPPVHTLKGYSSINLIHGLTHHDTESDPPSRDQVFQPLAYVVLATSEKTTR